MKIERGVSWITSDLNPPIFTVLRFMDQKHDLKRTHSASSCRTSCVNPDFMNVSVCMLFIVVVVVDTSETKKVIYRLIIGAAVCTLRTDSGAVSHTVGASKNLSFI